MQSASLTKSPVASIIPTYNVWYLPEQFGGSPGFQRLDVAPQRPAQHQRNTQAVQTEQCCH